MSRKRKASELEQTSMNWTTKKRKASVEQTSTNWTTKDIMNLVTGLQMYGFAETKKIAELVGTKDENTIKYFLANEANKIRQETNGRKGGSSFYCPDSSDVKTWPIIRKWRRMIYDQQLPYVRKQDYSKILFVDCMRACYEEAKEPKHPGLLNVKAIYKYLLDCFQGRPPAELSPIDSAVLLILIGQMNEMKRDFNFDEEFSFLKNFKRARPFAPFKVKDEFKEKTKKRTAATKKAAKSDQFDDEQNVNVEKDKDAIYVVEEMYYNLSRHRKLVQSINPLNVPLWTLIKDQSYVQYKCEKNA